MNSIHFSSQSLESGFGPHYGEHTNASLWRMLDFLLRCIGHNARKVCLYNLKKMELSRQKSSLGERWEGVAQSADCFPGVLEALGLISRCGGGSGAQSHPCYLETSSLAWAKWDLEGRVKVAEWLRVSLCSSGCPGTLYRPEWPHTHRDHLPPKSWDYLV